MSVCFYLSIYLSIYLQNTSCFLFSCEYIVTTSPFSFAFAFNRSFFLSATFYLSTLVFEFSLSHSLRIYLSIYLSICLAIYQVILLYIPVCSYSFIFLSLYIYMCVCVCVFASVCVWEREREREREREFVCGCPCTYNKRGNSLHSLSFTIFLFLFPSPTLFLYLSLYIYEEISFQIFFVWALLLIVHTWNFSPLRINLLRLQYACSTVPTTSGRPHGIPLVWACQSPSSWPLSSPQLSHNDSLWA